MAVLFPKPRSRAAVRDARDSSAVNGARIHERPANFGNTPPTTNSQISASRSAFEKKTFVGVTKNYLRLRIEAHLYHRRGWIAFNTAQTLGETDLYRISVHEIGHMLGLQHSSSAKSVMYFFNLEGPEWLDPADLAALAQRHKLRIATLDKAVSIGVSPQPEVARISNSGH